MWSAHKLLDQPLLNKAYKSNDLWGPDVIPVVHKFHMSCNYSLLFFIKEKKRFTYEETIHNCERLMFGQARLIGKNLSQTRVELERQPITIAYLGKHKWAVSELSQLTWIRFARPEYVDISSKKVSGSMRRFFSPSSFSRNNPRHTLRS